MKVMQPLVGPLNKRQDGTFVFAAPIRDGHMTVVALSDIGWWARYTFDHREETSGKQLKVASDMVSWDYLVSTFTKVTGQPAIFKRQELDEWWLNFDNVDIPLASDLRSDLSGVQVGGVTTVRQNFSAWWRQWRDDIIQRDMEWIRKVHPKGHTLESWMRATCYTGGTGLGVLKRVEQGKTGFQPKPEICSTL
jgi:NmrA-like family